MPLFHRAFRSIAIAILALTALAAQSLAAGQGAGAYRSDQKFASGLWMLTFDTSAGQIRVNLPERLTQGERVSGTIELYPRGQGRELQANLAALRTHTVRIDGEALAAADRSFLWRLPAEASNGRVELLDAAGSVVADVPTTFAPAGQVERPAGFDLPPVVQRGRAFLIRGPFDGDFANTRVLLGGRPAAKIAESSGVLVVENSAGDLGRVDALVVEGVQRQRAAFNSIEVRLSAPKGTAQPGGTMTVRARVEGLAGLREPFVLALYNHHPEVAALPAGQSVTQIVHPEEAGADGVFQLDLATSVHSFGKAEVVAAVGKLNASDVATHVVNVTFPPHTQDVTFPTYHGPNVTWPPHTPNASFPNYHAPNVTWPPHTPNASFPTVHAPSFTWPPHTVNVTFPTWHQTNVSWPPHTPGVSFPPQPQTDADKTPEKNP
ncbi:MAG TPA: hypothetical protein VGM86_24010 [Thermoanaerobaculia bacterium]|jgi:hypothetical protein